LAEPLPEPPSDIHSASDQTVRTDFTGRSPPPCSPLEIGNLRCDVIEHSLKFYSGE